MAELSERIGKWSESKVEQPVQLVGLALAELALRPLSQEDLARYARGAGQQVDILHVAEQSHGLGLFVRSLVGLDHGAATEAFGRFLDDSRFTVHQIRFVDLIVHELTSNGTMEPGRLYESPYTDHAPTGPDDLFPAAEVDDLVGILREVKDRARPVSVA